MTKKKTPQPKVVATSSYTRLRLRHEEAKSEIERLRRDVERLQKLLIRRAK